MVIFQPNRYSRTQALFDEFVTAFYQADVLLVMDVYAAGETPIEGVGGEGLAKAIAGHGHRQVQYCASEDAVVAEVLALLKPDDIVITLGAGSVWRVGETLIEALTRV